MQSSAVPVPRQQREVGREAGPGETARVGCVLWTKPRPRPRTGTSAGLAWGTVLHLRPRLSCPEVRENTPLICAPAFPLHADRPLLKHTLAWLTQSSACDCGFAGNPHGAWKSVCTLS